MSNRAKEPSSIRVKPRGAPSGGHIGATARHRAPPSGMARQAGRRTSRAGYFDTHTHAHILQGEPADCGLIELRA